MRMAPGKGPGPPLLGAADFISREAIFSVKYHSIGSTDYFQIGPALKHLRIGFGHFSGVYSQRVFNAHNFALRRRNKSNGAQSDRNGVTIVFKIHGHSGFFQADAGDTIFVGSGIIYFVHQSFGGDIRQTDSSGIALTSIR